ncbi:hyaluronan and proteoglycan link protein 2 isoform X1 [Anolis carolinensis]|uniref:hyaluronan and proteoglycan link protein 2 isoform X1 n=1 Tax=Anolis carolinensis TaxID=28377 RepID=UPI002F2B36A1
MLFLLLFLAFWGLHLLPKAAAIYQRPTGTPGPPAPLRFLRPPSVPWVRVRRGSVALLPCFLVAELPPGGRVRWSRVEAAAFLEVVIVVWDGVRHKSYGPLGSRARLKGRGPLDASLALDPVALEDEGRFRCQVVSGLEDESIALDLQLEGVVFPYQSIEGRYKFNYFDAKKVCQEQDARLATYGQLHKAWSEGLDWCNAGWVLEGGVHYPIVRPREPCGGRSLPPGVRTYAHRDARLHRFDAFCFTSAITGRVSFIRGHFTFREASQACGAEGGGASLAKVGQLLGAGHFPPSSSSPRLDPCKAGWLQDGSVRFPRVITTETPRPPHCGGVHDPALRGLGFPSKLRRKYGAYCYHPK